MATRALQVLYKNLVLGTVLSSWKYKCNGYTKTHWALASLGGLVKIEVAECGAREQWDQEQHAWSKSGVEANPNLENLILRLAGVGPLPPCPRPVCPCAHSHVRPPLPTGGGHVASCVARLNFLSPYKVKARSTGNSSLCK